MFTALEIAALMLTGVAMAPALAHALEHPGKMLLGREDYLTVQGIYYPGFTLAGLSEPIAVLAIAILLIFTPPDTPRFWLIAAALAAAALTHLFYWFLIAPINRVWLQGQKLPTSAGRFFGYERNRIGNDEDWSKLRDRWERAHIGRALTAAAAFVLLCFAVTQ